MSFSSMDIPEKAMKLGLALAREILRKKESGEPNVTDTAIVMTEGMGEWIKFCIIE